MPQKVSSRCAIQTINLNGNKLEGVVPSSWANRAGLEVLDLGRNKLVDSFPHWLMDLPALKVLVLNENRFFRHLAGICEGNHSFMMLQIFDISSNHFTNSLPSDIKTVTNSADVNKSADVDKLADVEAPSHTEDVTSCADCVFFSIHVNIMDVVTLGDVSGVEGASALASHPWFCPCLHSLNMSLNVFTGEIPWVLGDMSELEALDLSGNQLLGVIPSSLTFLHFSAFLNLSNNNLVGRIPQS
ncbi:receptor like protein 26-like [Dioscorea cayenensis subsp. rotundata]|uniref:Receptor like protein 26-like n=1 Tax=Dioscorea cayennensis subsp. rotundata TaxID=55577 RepID=A0AB40AJ19_DIOCR|nr:receptor like protein 26-like [Dioscorea cayenensis subsp. rotundata]